MTNYTSILRLRDMLDADKIPYEWSESKWAMSVFYPNRPVLHDTDGCQAVQGRLMFGSDDDLIELRGSLLTTAERKVDKWAAVVDAGEAYRRIAEHYGRRVLPKDDAQPTAQKRAGRPVICMDSDGNIIRQFSGITEAAKAVGALKANLKAVCDGRKKSCRGYRWAFADRAAGVGVEG